MASVSDNDLRPLVHALALAGGAGGVTDGQLLDGFVTHRREAAFRRVVDRHGPMVLGVCRRVLGDAHDAEDAFQATFLVLARKAASVVPREFVANWLYGVAYRTAQKARVTRRADAAKRRAYERVTAMGERTATDDEIWHDLQPVLDQELQRLPDAYRLAVVLCDLEGKSRKDAARQLDWPEGTLSGRLARARKLLAERLTRRGVTLSAAALAAALARGAAAAVPAALKSNVARAALLWAGGHALPAGVVSAEVSALTEGVMKTMLMAKLRIGVVVLAAALAMAGGADLVARRVVAAGMPQPPPAAGADAKKPGPAAVDAEMHVLGVYGSKAGFAERGRVDVEVKPTPKPVVLVLTSYYEVDWHVKLAAGARVHKVIASGYNGQTVQGLPAGVPVENHSPTAWGNARGPQPYFWASQWNTPQWRETVRRLNDLTGLPAATFQGEERGVAFVVDGTRGRDHGQKALTPRGPAPKEPTPEELRAAAAGAELHVVGMYTSDHDTSGKPVDIEVRATAKPVVLVLTSYMDAVWNVKCAAGARVKAVVAAGYFPQVVDGLAADVPVHHFCPDPRYHYFEPVGRKHDRSFYAYKWNTAEYRQAERTLNDATGLLVSTFQGEYAGRAFVVDGVRGREVAQTERKPKPVPPKEPTPAELRAAAADAKLHLVSVYQTDGGKGLPIEVEVRPTDKPVVLALASYYPALWTLKIADGARVKAVIVGGYYEQEWQGVPAGVPFALRTYFPMSNRNYFYGYKRDTPEYQGVLDKLNDMTGQLVATSQVEYSGKAFVIDGVRGRDHAQKARQAGGAKAPEAVRQPPKQQEDPLADVADVPAQDLRAGGDADKRYFLIGPKKDAKPPAAGHGLVVILPGGDGSADFNPFVRRIVKNALPAGYVAAQPVAPKWTEGQQIVWPTTTNPVDKMKFTTEDFIGAVVEDAAKTHALDRTRVFTLSWSSSGPAAYATALQGKAGVTGSLVAMSVFNPTYLPPLAGAKGHAFYLYHSPNDRVCPFRMAEQARDRLTENGAKVQLETYDGGHGWRGDVFGDIRGGVEWLEKNRAKANRP